MDNIIIRYLYTLQYRVKNNDRSCMYSPQGSTHLSLHFLPIEVNDFYLVNLILYNLGSLTGSDVITFQRELKLSKDSLSEYLTLSNHIRPLHDNILRVICNFFTAYSQSYLLQKHGYSCYSRK